MAVIMYDYYPAEIAHFVGSRNSDGEVVLSKLLVVVQLYNTTTTIQIGEDTTVSIQSRLILEVLQQFCCSVYFSFVCSGAS